MLVFPLNQLPTLTRGKGNKIIHIPADRLRSRKEFLASVAVLPADAQLKIQAGKRHFSLDAATLDQYMGKRGLRGQKLPRGFQKVDCLEIIR
jgi:topoisomerase-4 subunit A